MQFGHAWQRFLQHVAYVDPAYGPPLIAKLDLADGYYRVPLSSNAALELAVVLPPDGQSEPLIGLPLSLPMGWQQSPPYFCAFTETCADLANTQVASNPTHPYAYVLDAQHLTPHLARDDAPTAAWPHIQQLPPTPLQLVDVYLDDFIVMAQKPNHIAAMNNLLHHIDSVFRDTPGGVRRPLISQSKVAKGDATFSHQKIVLGWSVDTQRMEVSLPDRTSHHRPFS
jgi:hypothetical protein